MAKSFADIGYSKIDLNRQKRTGVSEVIYGQGKSAKEIIGIMQVLMKNNQPVLCTRIKPKKAAKVQKKFPKSVYHKQARCLTLKRMSGEINSKIAIVTAGTTDIPVAEEAAVTAEFMGNTVERIFDVGVAGLQRLLSKIDQIKQANVIIVVAGMEGALASVVAGLVSKPVIAVPTSVGYGTSFKGVSALLTMLNSCSSGVTVVNIDNGFGAGYSASQINQLILNPNKGDKK